MLLRVLVSVFGFFNIVIFVAMTSHGMTCVELFKGSDPLRSDIPKNTPDSSEGPGFIAPNERRIGELRNKLDAARAGIYVTVGTERGYMAAAMLKGKAKGLVLIDRDQKINLYNLVNRALLAMAKNRKHYLFLRLRANFKDIQRLIQNSPELSTENKLVLRNEKTWQWWQHHVQLSMEWVLFHQAPEKNGSREFENANYLFDDERFSYISRLARENKIFVIEDKLGTVSLQTRLEDLVAVLGAKVSVLDLSNAWQIGYLGHSQTIHLILNLSPLLDPAADLILTYLQRAQNNQQLESTFGYTILNQQDVANSYLFLQILRQMEMAEPSRGEYRRSRLERD